MVTRPDFTADAVTAARSVIVELFHLLGEYRDDIVVIGGWILLQLFSGIGSVSSTASAAGGVAYMAHIGGFFGGLLLSYFFRGKARALPPSYLQ